MANLQSGLILDPFAQNAERQAAAAEQSMSCGVLSIAQTAELIGASELQIRRVIALRYLVAHGFPTAPTTPGKPTTFDWRIFVEDAKQYIARGAYDAFAWRFDGSDDFDDKQSFYAAQRFSDNALPNAAAKAIPSDAVLAKTYADFVKAGKGGPTQNTNLSFDLSNAAPLAALMSEKTGDRYETRGMAFSAQMLRNAARMAAKNGELRPGENYLSALYESPSRFDKIANLGVEFMERQWPAFSLTRTITFWPVQWGIAEQGTAGDWSNSQEARGQQLMRGFQPDPRPSATAPTSQNIEISFSMSMKTLMDKFFPNRRLVIEKAF